MPADKTIDFVIMFLVIGLVTIGLFSMLVGWAVRLWDRLIMSRAVGVPGNESRDGEHRSDAAELGRELSGTRGRELVPALAEQLAALDDAELLEVLALIETEDGYRFAESRIAKFIPGRVEDRLDQVRAARGTTPEPPPGRVLKVRDQAGERVIPY